MPNSHSALEILDREFLDIRAKLLQLAAAFDRLDRAHGGAADDPRMQKIREAIDVLVQPAATSVSNHQDSGHGAVRAERIQLVFSRPYNAAWRSQFRLDNS